MKAANYTAHASIWDWSGHNRSDEFEFWKSEAQRYGNRVFAGMAAIGEVSAALAKSGFSVVSCDYTPAMIEEGQKRFGTIEGLTFLEADVTALDLEGAEFDFAFIGSTDLHHLSPIGEVEKALNQLHQLLRVGGGLTLELWHPYDQDWSSPKKTFEPLTSVFHDKKVWKEGQTRYDAATMRVFIDQTVFVAEGDRVQSFEHAFEMQLYPRESLLALIASCGFEVVSEYGDYGRKPFDEKATNWLVSCVKKVV